MSGTTKHTKDTKSNLPPGWRWVRLGDVCEQDRSMVDPKSETAAHLSYLGLEGIESQTGRILKAAIGNVSDEGISTTFAFDDRHVLYGKLRPYLNKVALPDFAGRCTTEIIPLLPKPELDKDYLCWLLRRTETVTVAMRDITGSRMPRADMSAILKHEIPLPPLSEQQRITGILKEQMTAVDKARAAAEERLAAVKALPTAFLRQVFGVAPVFTASPVTPQKPVKTGWKWHRLTDLARLATGHTPSRYHAEYWKGAVPWLQLADIRVLDGHEAQDTAEHTNELGLANSSSVLLPKDTVCMSRTASVGFFTVMGRPMCTSQDFVNWVCGDTLAPWFLLYLLIASREKIRELGSGAVHKTIYFPTVKNFSVCIPSLAEQRRYADLLRDQITAAEKARAAAEAELAAINALPVTLLRRAFNGEL